MVFIKSFCTGFLSIIIVRTVRRDIDEYNIKDDDVSLYLLNYLFFLQLYLILQLGNTFLIVFITVLF